MNEIFIMKTEADSTFDIVPAVQSSNVECIDLTESDAEEFVSAPSSPEPNMQQSSSECLLMERLSTSEERNRVLQKNSRHIPLNSNEQSSLSSQNALNSAPLDDSVHILYEKIESSPELEIVREIHMADIPDSTSNDCVPIEHYMNPLRVLASHFAPIRLETDFLMNSIFLNQLPDVLSNVVTDSRVYPNGVYPTERPQSENSRPLSPVRFGVTDSRNDSPLVQEIIQPRIETQTKQTVSSVHTNRNIPDSPPRTEKNPKIECGICFDGNDLILSSNRNLVSTVCGHIFCNVCIKMSLANSKQCPKCRKRLTAKQFHPIYF